MRNQDPRDTVRGEVMRFAALPFTLLLAACASYHVDYIDFVKANGITYVGGYTTGDRLGRPLTDADLGAEQFRVKQSLARAGNGPGSQVSDGDAAFVAVGEPVYSVSGYAPTFRLAARHDDRLVLYEADTNPAARTGRDLLDIEGKVVGMALVSGKDGVTILGRITDRSRIDDLVRLVLSAPVDQSPPSTAASSRTPLPTPTTPIQIRNYGVFVAFELADGSATRRSYDIANGVLQRGILLAGPFRSAIEELVAAAPTPTPLPSTINLTRRYDLARATRVRIKAPPTAPSQDPTIVSKLASALDTELPATRSALAAVDGLVITFEFGDHYVSLVYDRDSDLLRVVIPDDELAVTPSAELRQLLDAAR
jgi:hypothetical protein